MIGSLAAKSPAEISQLQIRQPSALARQGSKSRICAALGLADYGPVYALKSQKLEARARSLLLACKSYTEFCGQKAELARSVFIHEMNTARLIGVRAWRWQGGSSGVRGGVCVLTPAVARRPLVWRLRQRPPPNTLAI